jgi:hypothetical protein
MKGNAMFALEPAAMHALSELLIALAILVGSIWPNSIFKEAIGAANNGVARFKLPTALVPTKFLARLRFGGLRRNYLLVKGYRFLDPPAIRRPFGWRSIRSLDRRRPGPAAFHGQNLYP